MISNRSGTEYERQPPTRAQICQFQLQMVSCSSSMKEEGLSTLSVAPQEGRGGAVYPLLIFRLSYQPFTCLFMLHRIYVLVRFLEIDARHPRKERRPLLLWGYVNDMATRIASIQMALLSSPRSLDSSAFLETSKCNAWTECSNTSR